MRILQVVEACSAGVGRHVRGLSLDLRAQNHQLTVAYAPHRADEQFERFVADQQHEIRFVPLEMKREVSPVSDLKAVLRLMRVIREYGPFDVVHGHSAKGGAVARIAGRLFGLPTVYTPHALIVASPTLSRPKAVIFALIERLLGRWATSEIIAVSEGERAFIVKLGLVPTERITVVANGLDDGELEYLHVEHTRKDLSEEPLTFGSIMRFAAQKAPDQLVEAFIRVSETLPQIPTRLVVAGDGELFREVKRKVEASGMDERILLLGWRTDIREVLREFDVLVVPSLYEAGSYSLIEAMAAGLPVVSTRVSGTEETIRQVPGNIVVPKGEPEALADGMMRMATLDESRALRQSLQRIGQANRDFAHAHFRRSETVQRTLEVYRALCS